MYQSEEHFDDAECVVCGRDLNLEHYDMDHCSETCKQQSEAACRVQLKRKLRTALEFEDIRDLPTGTLVALVNLMQAMRKY